MFQSNTSVRKSPGTLDGPRGCHRKEERSIVQRRNAQSDRLELWTSVDDYFKAWDLQVSKFSTWSSPEFYTSSSIKNRKKVEEESRRRGVEERRKALSVFLQTEQAEYDRQIRLKSMLGRDEDGSSLRGRNLNIKSKVRTAEASNRDVELKLYHRAAKFPSEGDMAESKPDERWSVDEDKDKSKEIERGGIKSTYKEPNINVNVNLLKSQLERLMGKLQLQADKRNNLKIDECEIPEEMSEIVNLMEELKELLNNQYAEEQLGPEEVNLDKWKSRSDSIQRTLRKQVELLDRMVKLGERLRIAGHGQGQNIKYNAEKVKKSVWKALLVETGRERFAHLLESTTRKPADWWAQETSRWHSILQQTYPTVENVFDQFNAAIKTWSEKNLNDQAEALEAEDEIIGNIEKVRSELERYTLSD